LAVKWKAEDREVLAKADVWLRMNGL